MRRSLSPASSCWTRTTLPRARLKASSSAAKVCASQGDDGAASRRCSRRMRRTVLRESFSTRLISRRLRPCALRTRTLLRISVRVVIGISLDVSTKAFKILVNERYGRHQLLGRRTQIRQSFAHTADQHIDASQIDLAAAFRAIAQTLAHALLDALLQGCLEQMRMVDQAFSSNTAGLLVMLEPAAQLAGGQWRDR